MPKIAFAGLSVLTQIAIALQQLLLLPLLLRLWGKADTAEWFAVISFSMLASIADLGMRTLGLAELRAIEADDDPHSRKRFLSAWSWVRLFVPMVSLGLCAVSLLSPIADRPAALWPMLLILSAGLETLLIVRIIYLDTLGRYVAAEAVYAGFAAGRLILLVAVAGFFDPEQTDLAAIFLVTAMLALAVQELSLGGRRHLSLFAPLAPAARELAAIPYALAEPAANWVRLSLPVLVLYRIAVPEMVTLFIGLRAGFSLVRSTVSQASRVVSVEYVQTRERAPGRADAGLVLALAGTAILGGAVGVAVIADHGRLLALWLGPMDLANLVFVSLYFAISAPFYGHQAIIGVLLRIGRWRAVGRLLHGYALASFGIALVCLIFPDPTLYLLAAGLVEIGVGLGFFWLMSDVANPDAMWKSAAAAIVTAAVCLLWWLAVRVAPGLFETLRPIAGAWTLAALVATGAALACGLLMMSGTELRRLRKRT